MKTKKKIKDNRPSGKNKEFRPDFVAYTDGSCNNLSPYGEGGSAYVILCDGVPIHEARRGSVGTTNNRMEMMAIISAINWVPAKSKILIRTDSLYCIKTFTGRWRGKSNTDLIRLYDSVSARLSEIRFHWVKGHNGDEWNEYVDNLATTSTADMVRKYSIPVYDFSNSPKIVRNGV